MMWKITVQVAPRYGTNEDLARLFEEAHSKGLHVILGSGAGTYRGDAQSGSGNL